MAVVEAVININAASLGYVSQEGLMEAGGIPKENLCMGMPTGIYPVEIPSERCLAAQTKLSECIIKATEESA